MEEWDEERDIMVFIDDDDLEFLEGLSDVNRLKIFDALKRLPKFPGYQPKSSSESFSDIVIKSVGLMHVLNIKKKLPAKEVEEFEDLITDIRVEVKHQEWIQKSRKCVGRLPGKGEGGTKKYRDACEGSEKLDKSDAGTAKYGDTCEGDSKQDEALVSEELMNKKTSPSCSTPSRDVHKDDNESPSHFLSKNDSVIEVKKPIKHDALRDAFGELITGNTEIENTEKTKVPLSPAAFSEDNASPKEDFGDLIDQIQLDEEEKKTEQITEQESGENGDKNKDCEVSNDEEEKEGSFNKHDVLVRGASTDDNSMEGNTKNAEAENSEGKTDVRY